MLASLENRVQHVRRRGKVSQDLRWASYLALRRTIWEEGEAKQKLVQAKPAAEQWRGCCSYDTPYRIHHAAKYQIQGNIFLNQKLQRFHRGLDGYPFPR